MPVETKIDPRSIVALQEYLRSLPRGAMKIATRASAEYLVGDEDHGLKHLAKYKYVSRAKAYPPSGFFSDKQRRYVMAAIREGRIKIPYQRTGNLSDNWKITGDPYRLRIRNESAYAKYVLGDQSQSRHEAMVGHRRMASVIASNIRGAIRHARAEVNKFLQARNKKK